MRNMPFWTLLMLLIGAALAGCGNVSNAMKPTWYEKVGWKAEDYFDDPKVIALCNAIEARNVKEINRLVADGDKCERPGQRQYDANFVVVPRKKPGVLYATSGTWC